MVPALANCRMIATYAGLRPATEHADYQVCAHRGAFAFALPCV